MFLKSLSGKIKQLGITWKCLHPVTPVTQAMPEVMEIPLGSWRDCSTNGHQEGWVTRWCHTDSPGAPPSTKSFHSTHRPSSVSSSHGAGKQAALGLSPSLMLEKFGKPGEKPRRLGYRGGGKGRRGGREQRQAEQSKNGAGRGGGGGGQRAGTTAHHPATLSHQGAGPGQLS